MKQKSKSKKHTQSIGGFLSPLWFPIPVPNPVWERFSFCFLFAFHLHFFRFFFKKWEKRKKRGKNWKTMRKKCKKKQKHANPINFAFFSLVFCISPSVLAVFSKFDITFGTFPGSTTCGPELCSATTLKLCFFCCFLWLLFVSFSFAFILLLVFSAFGVLLFLLLLICKCVAFLSIQKIIQLG